MRKIRAGSLPLAWADDPSGASRRRKKAGEAYHGLGETDQVFALFEEAYRNRDGTLPLVLLYPIFDPIRSDPRFVSLLQRVFVPFPEN